MSLASEIFGEVIYSYTRTQAIKDGELVDVSKAAKEAGFKMPVAVTEALWRNYVEWTDDDTDRQIAQDTNGRLGDVLWMLRLAISASKNVDHITYQANVVPKDGKTKKPLLTEFKAVVGAGDNGEPVITIMLPNED
jgi:type I site-specific restriction-modification system R (restriction) subunit